jgi:AraC family transcriptional regulator
MATLDIEWSSRPTGGMIDLESLKRRSWPGIAVYAVKIAAPATYDFKLKSASNYVVLRDFYRNDGETRVEGRPPCSTKDMRNKLGFIPAGVEVTGWHQLDKPAAVVAVILDRTASTRPGPDLTSLSPRIEFEDPLLRSLILRFRALLDDPSLDTPGYAETLAELVTYELVRSQSSQRNAQSARSGLTAAQIKLVTEYMNSHMSEKTSVSELAALVDLTRFHFIRAFKQAAGVPPHQFMIRLRVDRAKQLLAEQSASVAEIAERTGFGSPVQMTRAFRRVIGTTPSAYRRNDC